MQVIIDRFEGDMAVVELPDGAMTTMPAILLPGAVEGDVVMITIDKTETIARKKRVNSLLKKLSGS